MNHMMYPQDRIRPLVHERTATLHEAARRTAP